MPMTKPSINDYADQQKREYERRLGRCGLRLAKITHDLDKFLATKPKCPRSSLPS